jgi:hypothetical protein
MRISNLPRSVRVMLVGGALVAVAGVGLISHGQVARPKLPRGSWTFSAGPQKGIAYKSVPVDVFKVSTKASEGLTVGSVSLHNRSLQDVKEVKLHWYLKEKSQKNILAEGDTGFFDVTLPAGGRLPIDYPIVSFEKLSKTLVKDGVLSGDYRIEVVVAALSFADGSKWTSSNPGPVRLAHAFSLAPDPGCQNQGCVWNGAEGSYVCGANDGSFCSVGSQGQSCTESRCPGLGD